MAEYIYIEREATINRIKEYALDAYDIDLDDAKQFNGSSRTENCCEGLYEATELVDDIPAADVAPVVHGRWIDDGRGIIICPECERGYNLHAKYTHYCPNCGAKMDGGAANR